MQAKNKRRLLKLIEGHKPDKELELKLQRLKGELLIKRKLLNAIGSKEELKK